MVSIKLGNAVFRILKRIGLNVGKDGTIFVNCAKKLGKHLYKWKKLSF